MKIIGQSILVDAKPYLHLAYGSATTDSRSPEATFLWVGLLLGLVGVLHVVRAAIERTGWRWLSPWPKLWRWVLISLAVWMLGAALSFFAMWCLWDNTRPYFTIGTIHQPVLAPVCVLGLGAVVFAVRGLLTKPADPTTRIKRRTRLLVSLGLGVMMLAFLCAWFSLRFPAEGGAALLNPGYREP
jgi:hypothetical protein